MPTPEQQLYPQARQFQGRYANGLLLQWWLADHAPGLKADGQALHGCFVVGANEANAHQDQRAVTGDWIVVEGPGLARVDERAPEGAEARAVADALLSLAASAGIPDTLWASDTRIAIACETLDITPDQARDLAESKN